MKIFKYPLQLIEKQTIKIPIGAKVLTAQVHEGNICLWAQVNETAFLEPRDFAIYWTGRLLPESIGDYIATVQFNTQFDSSICHVFEVKLWPSQY